jgi:hypothetical protein
MSPEHPLAFEPFFEDEKDRLLRILYLITGSSGEADDLAQEPFIRLFERSETVSVMADPAGYLHRGDEPVSATRPGERGSGCCARSGSAPSRTCSSASWIRAPRGKERSSPNAGIAFGFVHVYADGRVIYAFADPTLAILERRLTPEGAVKVRDLLRG